MTEYETKHYESADDLLNEMRDEFAEQAVKMRKKIEDDEVTGDEQKIVRGKLRAYRNARDYIDSYR